MSAKTKLVRIQLSALTRVEYTEVVEVPIDWTTNELENFVDQRWDDVDGGCFVEDPNYWEKGDCNGSEADSTDEKPELSISMDAGGVYVYKTLNPDL